MYLPVENCETLAPDYTDFTLHDDDHTDKNISIAVSNFTSKKYKLMLSQIVEYNVHVICILLYYRTDSDDKYFVC